MAIGLLGFGIKLKPKYEDYSAVLVGGAMAILYFITYIAYSFYGLMPQLLAFAMMFLFTAFTVVAAIQYNRQIIAHIGLVGAYSVPFLLSNGSGNAAILFSYMTIINGGILFIAFKRYWKSLYYASFGLTWLIFMAWFSDQFKSEDFVTGMTFLSIFFAIFYALFLAYKLIKSEALDAVDGILLLLNSAIFYGLGCAFISTRLIGDDLLGAFTLLNAVIHFGVGMLIRQRKMGDKSLFLLIVGLVLVFLTVAIPVQLDGNSVTILWAAEAALLFWIGRTQKVRLYETLSYSLMFLSTMSVLEDILTHHDYGGNTKFLPVFNANFLCAMLFCGIFAFINYINHNKKYSANGTDSSSNDDANHKTIETNDGQKILTFTLTAILIGILYLSLQMQINGYFEQAFADSMLQLNKNASGEYLTTTYNYDIQDFQTVWSINFGITFLIGLSFFNIKKLHNREFAYANLLFNLFGILVFMGIGLLIFNKLNESYQHQIQSQYYKIGIYNILIRYISIGFLAALVYTVYKYIQQKFLEPTPFNLKISFELLLHGLILCLSTSELLNIMRNYDASASDKLGLSIFWGLYALLLIVLGIWKNKKYLRIFAIILFSLTLLKLFLYDIAQLETIAKTIVLVCLGILLLLISFLYNKYKHLITEA
jgi:uncharacterized membrane protein